jgi:hypothetical protein
LRADSGAVAARLQAFNFPFCNRNAGAHSKLTYRVSRKESVMKRALTLASAALAVVALSLTPATAKSKKKHYRHHGYYSQPYAYQPYAYPGWYRGNVSDPSFSNRAGINYAYRTGRCVVDLGYGRYEYCGW